MSSNVEEFIDDAERLFNERLDVSSLLSLSQGLQEQFKRRLQASDICMLPSFNHTLPRGDESGSYLAVDVGGSNLRVALVDLGGNQSSSAMKIVRLLGFPISSKVRSLKGVEFFDWMAERIEELTLCPEVQQSLGHGPYIMGVAWSFPVKQTSVRSGLLLEMGKGFAAADGLFGEDLGDLVTDACKKRGMDVRLEAIINDGSATLLSHAYTNRTTRFGLILGTGTNMSVLLPVAALSAAKFADRPAAWLERARDVVVNTEFSMFGGAGLLPRTRWDEAIRRAHTAPDFQPFEMLVGGRYLGEIVRLVLLEGVANAGLFGGEVPAGLGEPYGLDTGTLAAIEGDTTPDMAHATAAFHRAHPLRSGSPPSVTDVRAVRRAAGFVTVRAASLLAAGVHAMWSLRRSASALVSHVSEEERPGMGHPGSFACNGSVVERYPGFRERVQRVVGALAAAERGQLGEGEVADPPAVLLHVAEESAIFGAAVAVACEKGNWR